jgi:hypothetical protein
MDLRRMLRAAFLGSTELFMKQMVEAAGLLKTSVANVDQLLEGARKRIGRTASAQQVSTPT